MSKNVALSLELRKKASARGRSGVMEGCRHVWLKYAKLTDVYVIVHKVSHGHLSWQSLRKREGQFLFNESVVVRHLNSLILDNFCHSCYSHLVEHQLVILSRRISNYFCQYRMHSLAISARL